MSENVTPKQRKAVESLLANGDMSAAAESAGVSRRTLYRWQSKAAFQTALKEAEGQALQAFSRRLAGMAEKAAEALSDGLEHEDIRIRLRAASLLTSRLLAIREMLDFDLRLTELERRMDER